MNYTTTHINYPIPWSPEHGAQAETSRANTHTAPQQAGAAEPDRWEPDLKHHIRSGVLAFGLTGITLNFIKDTIGYGIALGKSDHKNLVRGQIAVGALSCLASCIGAGWGFLGSKTDKHNGNVLFWALTSTLLGGINAALSASPELKDRRVQAQLGLAVAASVCTGLGALGTFFLTKNGLMWRIKRCMCPPDERREGQPMVAIAQ